MVNRLVRKSSISQGDHQMPSEPPKATQLLGVDGNPIGTIYDFAKAGDCLPQHAHEYNVNDHFTVIAKGGVKVSSGPQTDPTKYWETLYPSCGPVLDHKPLAGEKYVVHEFTALEDGTRIVNIRKGAVFVGNAAYV